MHAAGAKSKLIDHPQPWRIDELQCCLTAGIFMAGPAGRRCLFCSNIACWFCPQQPCLSSATVPGAPLPSAEHIAVFSHSCSVSTQTSQSWSLALHHFAEGWKAALQYGYHVFATVCRARARFAGQRLPRVMARPFMTPASPQVHRSCRNKLTCAELLPAPVIHHTLIDAGDVDPVCEYR